ncbi:Mur ligase [Dipodascopsis tothii]|uniref:Mur ligase n=1 Tax=Dipodascopsis tothii TaxID=44089 RepID=UPI0034CDA7E3
MGIDLGLARTARLLGQLANPHRAGWKVFHVAGTNGKGSVCAYLSSVLAASGVRTGRYTSPHLLDRWDCVSIDERPVRRSVFEAAEAHVNAVDAQHKIGATEFERLTATAFEVFRREAVDAAVVEVGLGGRRDATNMDFGPGSVVGTVLTRIGMDHESFLGNTLGEIAREKAGIVRAGVPCTVSGQNAREVLDVVAGVAAAEGAELRVVQVDGGRVHTPELGPLDVSGSPLAGAYQPMNLACALTALAAASASLPAVTAATIAAGVRAVHWPGRLQWLQLDGRPVLVDGAHNAQAAAALSDYVERTVRRDGPVTWVMALTQGKEVDGILSLLLRPGDSFVGVQFGAVEGMPWIRPVDPAELRAAAGRVVGANAYASYDRVRTCLSTLAQGSPAPPLVVCGSLYLVADLLRDLQAA